MTRLLTLVLTIAVLGHADAGSFNNHPGALLISKYHDSDIILWTIAATCTVTDSCVSYTCHYYWGWGGWMDTVYAQYCRTVAVYQACSKNVQCIQCEVTTDPAFYAVGTTLYKRACKLDESGYCLEFDTTTIVGVRCWNPNYYLSRGEIATSLDVVTGYDCGEPPTEGYVFGEKSSTIDGIRISILSCAVGYAGTPTVNAIACHADGSWDNLSGCEKVGCGYPSKTGYKFGTPENTTVGSFVNVDSCEEGYTGTPAPNQLICQETKTWADVTGCNILTCPPLSVPDKAAITTTEVIYGTIVLVYCDFDYVLAGASTLTCTINGTWDNPLPFCRANTTTTAISSTVPQTSVLYSVRTREALNETTVLSTATANATYPKTTEYSILTSQNQTTESTIPAISVSQQQSTEQSMPLNATENSTDSGMPTETATQSANPTSSVSTISLTQNAVTTSRTGIAESSIPITSLSQTSATISIISTTNATHKGTTELKPTSTSTVTIGTTESSTQTTNEPRRITTETNVPTADASQKRTTYFIERTSSSQKVPSEISISTHMSLSQTGTSQADRTGVSELSEMTTTVKEEGSTQTPITKAPTNAPATTKPTTAKSASLMQNSNPKTLSTPIVLAIEWAVLILLCING